MGSAIELAAVLVWLAAAFALAGRSRLGQVPARWWRRLARGNGREVIIVGAFALAASALASIGRWPEPRVHDEFSYLLAADTFAQGRLCNPTHPLWVFFETFHVNPVPTYASVYPPAQGAALALGQAAFGYPLVGVWISFALACAGICWMLRGWLPPRWALLGGLLAAIRLGFLAGSGAMQGYWSQSYWGGAMAMLGGALVFGALPRLVRRPGLRGAFAMAAGLAILANSRPFEGLVLGSTAVAAAAIGLSRRPTVPRRRLFVRVLIPFAALMAVTAAGMAYYNARVAGSPTLLPYVQNGRLYGRVPLFLWQPLAPEHEYHHRLMREYAESWARPRYEAMRTPSGYLREVAGRIQTFFAFFCGPVLMIPLLGLASAGRDRRLRVPLLACALLTGALLMTTWFQPHYAAPAAGLMFLLIVQGIRRLRLWRCAGRPVGAVLVGTLPLLYGALLIGFLANHRDANADSWHRERARLLERLEREPGRHLVVVHYGPDHSPHREWVYNRADIDNARVVWARDMGDNAGLLRYFREWHIWLVDADAEPPRLRPYPRYE